MDEHEFQARWAAFISELRLHGLETWMLQLDEMMRAADSQPDIDVQPSTIEAKASVPSPTAVVQLRAWPPQRATPRAS